VRHGKTGKTSYRPGLNPTLQAGRHLAQVDLRRRNREHLRPAPDRALWSAVLKLRLGGARSVANTILNSAEPAYAGQRPTMFPGLTRRFTIQIIRLNSVSFVSLWIK